MSSSTFSRASGRVTRAITSTSEWWLDQMIPITRKLTA